MVTEDSPDERRCSNRRVVTADRSARHAAGHDAGSARLVSVPGRPSVSSESNISKSPYINMLEE